MLARIGARVWIARIMITWGLISAAMAFIETPGQFYVLRFLLGAAEALRESLGVGLAPAEQATHDDTVAAVQAALGEERFSAAWRQGRELALDEAIAYALEEEEAQAHVSR